MLVANLATNIPPLARAARASAWAVNDRLRREASGHLVDGALATGASRYIQESICFPYRDGGDEWIDESHPVDHVGPLAAAADSDHVRTFNTTVRRRINPFVGDPEGFVSFVHADDAAAAVVAALTAPTGIYNIANEPVTRAEAGRIVAETLGVKPPRGVPKPLRAASPSSAKLLMRSQRVSHERFTAATGWTPVHESIRGSWPANVAP